MKQRGQRTSKKDKNSVRPRLANYNDLPPSPDFDFAFANTKAAIAVLLVFATAYATFIGSRALKFTYDDELAIILNRDVNTYTPLSNLLTNDFWCVLCVYTITIDGVLILPRSTGDRKWIVAKATR
jgi:hypothetical protein